MKGLLKNLMFSILVVGAVLLSAEIPLRIFWYSPAPMPPPPQQPDYESQYKQATTSQTNENKVQKETAVQSEHGATGLDSTVKKAEVIQKETVTQSERSVTEQRTEAVQKETVMQPECNPPSYRILLLGDSFAFGIGVRPEDRFADVLNSMLGNKVKVINTGNGGWSTARELLYFMDAGYRYKPNMVIYQFFWNDILENMQWCSYQDNKSKLEEKGVRVQMKPIDSKAIALIVGGDKGPVSIRIEYLRAWLCHHSSLYNALRAFFVKTRLLESKPLNEFMYERFVKPLDINLTLDLTKQLKDKVKEGGADKFIVAIVPSNGHSLPADFFWPIIKDLLDKEGIPYIYPSEFEKNIDTFYIPVDGHFSIKGNKRFAEHLYKLIISLEPSLARPQ